MTHACRQMLPFGRRRKSCEVLRHAHVVSDPQKLAHLRAEAERVRLSSEATLSSTSHKR
jgi:hypothetical protein